MEYVVLICARNEEKYIGSCLSSLYFQSIPPKLVIVVDDGSTDETRTRALEFKDKMTLMIISKPDRGYSALGTPLMADTYNVGLKILVTVKWDFLLILGADTSIPPNYVNFLWQSMDSKKGVVSGRYPGIRENYAAATGRFIRRRIIDKLGGRLPQINGWEGSVNLCAQFLGYERRSFDIPIYNLRPPRHFKRSYTGSGRALKEMGFCLPNVCFKGFLMLKKFEIVAALQMFYGYFTHKPQDPLPDWAQYNNELLKKALKEKLKGG